jgi:Fe-S-cluster-containing dehydrogenase component/DMSO reductase anchor subunit
MTKNIFVFDQNKCVGCSACSVGCMNENGEDSAIPWRNIYTSNPDSKPDIPLFYLSMACNHCDDAPCMKSCPALSYSRDGITGAVLHHADKCIGCQYCTWACPFDAPKYNPKKGIVEKCTFCNHRIKEGEKPACAALCPVGALDFETTEFSREEALFTNVDFLDVGPKLKIIPFNNEAGPEFDSSLFATDGVEAINLPKEPKISARKEWPLLIFTLLVTAMVSIYSARISVSFELGEKVIFIVVGVVAAIFSTLHLGKKTRAWRAVLNIRHSWLSREIAFFGLFIMSLVTDFFIVDLPYFIPVIFGVGLLISIDMLYQIATWKWALKIHSAQTLFIGLSLFFLLKGALIPFVAIVFVRLFLYIYRNRSGRKWLKPWNLLRLALLVSSMVFAAPIGNFMLSVALFSFGEILDRIDFYNELNVPTPKDLIKS